MSKRILFILAFFAICLEGFSQFDFDDGKSGHDIDPNKPSFYDKYIKGKTYTGGTGGLALGTTTIISLNPILGYKFNKYFRAGLGVNYQYVNYKYYGIQYSSYGGRAFGNYYFIPQAYFTAEYSLMNILNPNTTTNERAWFPSLLAGAGYSQSLGGLSSYNIEVLWNVLKSPVYPINFPIFRIGINIGI